MPGREYQAQPSRFGFNGKENDHDVKGFGNQQDYGMRIYDPRLGKFLSLDPISQSYPYLTPYQFASNRPIDGVDLDGLEWELSTTNNHLKQRSEQLRPARPDHGTISVWDPSKRRWTQKWRDSDNFFANVTYDIANGLYTLPQQMTASIRNDDFINNIGGNVHRAHGIEGEKQRLKNFVNGTTVLLPAAPVESKLQGVLANYTDDLILKIENQVTQQVPERVSLISELVEAGIKHSADDIIHIGKNPSGKIIFLEKGNVNAGLEHILSHSDEFVANGIPKSDIGKVVFEAATKGKQVGMQGGTRPIYQVTFKGEVKNIAITIGDNGFIVGANPTTKIK